MTTTLVLACSNVCWLSLRSYKTVHIYLNIAACEDGFGMHGDGKGKIKANKLKTLHTMLDLEEPDDIANKILENKDIDGKL